MTDNTPVMTAAEYADSVNEWLKQAYNWHIFTMSFPSYVAYQMSLQGQQQQQSTFQNINFIGGFNQIRQQTSSPAEQTSREFRVPSIWKRLAAESIDFVFLLVVKLLITLVIVDTMDIFHFEKYDTGLASLLSGEDMDVDTALELTSDIVLLELLNRIVVCVFETLCTYKGPLGSPGGATPGKLVMGLRIVKCEQVSMTANLNEVRVTPASDLGLFWAFFRSFFKNMSMAFLFPACFTFLFLPFNRTIYDVFSKSIVVEVDQRELLNRVRRF